MVSNLILDSLEIRNFRGFKHLQIERLARVNLIVGKNNVGKSSLLEAIQLYAHRGSPILLREQLRARDESRPVLDRSGDAEEFRSVLKYVFYGRSNVIGQQIQIGPVNSQEETLFIAVNWGNAGQIGDELRLVQLPEAAEGGRNAHLIPGLTIHLGKQLLFNLVFLPAYPIPSSSLNSDLKDIATVFIVANGLGKREITELWDSIALTDLEKEVLAALRFVAPGVEGITLVSDPALINERIPIVKVKGIDDRLPLRSLGDGMQRVLGISLALANAKNGLLLIDEFENGLHYAIQPDLWRLIFQVARRLNVQVFATTHSWDCIESFQEASNGDHQEVGLAHIYSEDDIVPVKVTQENHQQEKHQEEGLLIRLESKKNGIKSTLFDKRQLEIATREQIEVR